MSERVAWDPQPALAIEVLNGYGKREAGGPSAYLTKEDEGGGQRSAQTLVLVLPRTCSQGSTWEGGRIPLYLYSTP